MMLNVLMLRDVFLLLGFDWLNRLLQLQKLDVFQESKSRTGVDGVGLIMELTEEGVVLRRRGTGAGAAASAAFPLLFAVRRVPMVSISS